jgi:hypothetical protein
MALTGGWATSFTEAKDSARRWSIAHNGETAADRSPVMDPHMVFGGRQLQILPQPREIPEV